MDVMNSDTVHQVLAHVQSDVQRRAVTVLGEAFDTSVPCQKWETLFHKHGTKHELQFCKDAASEIEAELKKPAPRPADYVFRSSQSKIIPMELIRYTVSKSKGLIAWYVPKSATRPDHGSTGEEDHTTMIWAHYVYRNEWEGRLDATDAQTVAFTGNTPDNPTAETKRLDKNYTRRTPYTWLEKPSELGMAAGAAGLSEIIDVWQCPSGDDTPPFYVDPLAECFVNTAGKSTPLANRGVAGAERATMYDRLSSVAAANTPTFVPKEYARATLQKIPCMSAACMYADEEYYDDDSISDRNLRYIQGLHIKHNYSGDAPHIASDIEENPELHELIPYRGTAAAAVTDIPVLDLTGSLVIEGSHPDYMIIVDGVARRSLQNSRNATP